MKRENTKHIHIKPKMNKPQSAEFFIPQRDSVELKVIRRVEQGGFEVQKRSIINAKARSSSAYERSRRYSDGFHELIIIDNLSRSYDCWNGNIRVLTADFFSATGYTSRVEFKLGQAPASVYTTGPVFREAVGSCQQQVRS